MFSAGGGERGRFPGSCEEDEELANPLVRSLVTREPDGVGVYEADASTGMGEGQCGGALLALLAVVSVVTDARSTSSSLLRARNVGSGFRR